MSQPDLNTVTAPDSKNSASGQCQNNAPTLTAAHPLLGRTLADAMSQGYDNFSLLRFLAAALVIFGHSWATAKNPSGATDWIGQQTLISSGTVAVNIFFWVSGFLITMSYIRNCSLLLSFPLTLALAIPSWHFVEKPMLRFKS